MIGVACLCNEENMRGVRCLKHMSQDKIREKNLFKNIIDEVSIMYELIGVQGVCQIEDLIINENRDITIVLPFFSLTDLWNYMKVKPGRHLSERDARTVFRQLVECFIGIHGRRIMHRDIKPENVMIGEDSFAKLIDFGLSKSNRMVDNEIEMSEDVSAISASRATGLNRGTLSFMAPELLAENSAWGDAKRGHVRVWHFAVRILDRPARLSRKPHGLPVLDQVEARDLRTEV